MRNSAYVVRHRTTSENEWEREGQQSYGRWLMFCACTTWDAAKDMAQAAFLSDAIEDKPIVWNDEASEVTPNALYGVVKDGGYVTEYMVERLIPINSKDAKSILDHARTERTRWER